MLEMTREELEAEVAEKQADLQALLQSRDIIWQRCVQLQEHSKSRLTPFQEWAGTHALMNSFDVFIHAAERLVEELKGALAGLPPEPLRLRIVRNDEQGTPEAS